MIIIVPVIPILYPNNWLKSKYWLNKKLPIKIKNPSEKSDFKFNKGYFAESTSISRIFMGFTSLIVVGVSKILNNIYLVYKVKY